PSKRWKIEKLAALLDKIEAAGMEVVVTGSLQDKKLLESLKQLSKTHFIDAVSQTGVLQLACLIKRCDVYITSDSAPLHIAYAMKTPVVALFGPTDPRRHTILNAKQIIINRRNLSCSPCYRRRCNKHTCMEEISVEGVFAAVKMLLGGHLQK
ncbi:MAG: glycosyltransferase family 9 protein, partial [Omnitrophica bacterium]|nr:glycosyltransferase family 9 protein [Candidatus Omnitrophota bacterium]